MSKREKLDRETLDWIAAEKAAARRDMARLAKEDRIYEALDRAAGAPIVEPRDWTEDDLPEGGGSDGARRRMIFRDLHRSDPDPDYREKWQRNLDDYIKTHDERGNPINK